jgi:hypothetical protein
LIHGISLPSSLIHTIFINFFTTSFSFAGIKFSQFSPHSAFSSQFSYMCFVYFITSFSTSATTVRFIDPQSPYLNLLVMISSDNKSFQSITFQTSTWFCNFITCFCLFAYIFVTVTVFKYMGAVNWCYSLLFVGSCIKLTLGGGVYIRALGLVHCDVVPYPMIATICTVKYILSPYGWLHVARNTDGPD